MPDEIRPASWQDLITAEAKKQRVDPRLALAVAETESSFNPAAKSPKGALGLFQLMPETAARRGVDPLDPVQNIRGGIGELRSLLDAHQNDVVMALRRYNGSPQASEVATQPYVDKVLGKLRPEASVQPGTPPPTAAGIAAPAVAVSHTQPEGVDELPAPPPVPPEGWSDWALRHGKGMLQQFDPRTPEGRRNLAGAGGAALGTAAVVGTAPVSVPVGLMTAATAGILGAVGGGMTAEAGEQIVGTKPPSGVAVAGAGVEQGAYETLGAGTVGLGKAIGRRIAGGQMAKVVTTKGSELATRALAPLKIAFGATESKAAKAGKLAQEVISGPSQHALDIAGQRVTKTAESGPPVNITGLKAEAQRILEQEIRPPAEAFPRQTTAQVGNEAITAQSGIAPDELMKMRAAPAGSKAARNLADLQAAVASAQGEAEKEVLKHPAMGVLNRILNAEDTVSFANAHAFKRELDEAVGATWDRSVTKRVTNITKTLRGTLREALGGYAPYNEATARYAQIAPLFRKEIAPRLRKVAETAPETLVDLIKGNRPGPAQMLKDVLTTQAEAGGAPEAGHAAWDTVRAAWLHDKLIGVDLAALPTKLQKLDPAFAETMLGDPVGRQVRTNLEALGQVAQAASRAATTTPVHGGISLRGAVYGWIPVKKLLTGPKAADVAAWAALAPERTRAWVAFVSSPTPKTAQALAGLARSTGFVSPVIDALTVQPLPSHEVGPPPVPGPIGTPPPGRVAAAVR